MADTQLPSDDERRQAAVVSEHLPAGYTAEHDGPTSDQDAGSSGDNEGAGQEQEQESSLKLQGGDIHRDLFKIDARSRLPQRAATFSTPQQSPHRPEVGMTAAEQRIPGGFRRQYILQRAGSVSRLATPVSRNFVEFLDLYGSFAGEDLAESDDEALISDDEEAAEANGETRPLLGRRKSSRVTRKGDAGTAKSFFTLLKAFVGTGIMFLPKAFNNGGLLFSSLTLVFISLVTLLAFHLLLQCRTRYGGGYGELGESIGGSKFRLIILGSITISQLGFVCSGIIFVAENLMNFLNAVTSGSSPLSTKALIALQVVVLVPLSFIRNISKLGPAALLADVFILLGLTYIYYYDIATISTQGINKTVQMFNPDHYTLTIGAAIFTFEGIGLILPIQSSMKRPEKFEPLLCVVMFIITIVFVSVGFLCYITFGADTQIEIITNFPQDSKIVQTVQFIYSIAVLVGNPVQLFPALRILEGKLFGHLSGKKDLLTKWKKNAFRTGLVVFCAVIAILGSNNLDRFVALIGSFACVPLVYIYPPLLHYKGIAETRLAKAGDVIFMVLGLVAMIYTTCVTIVNSFS